MGGPFGAELDGFDDLDITGTAAVVLVFCQVGFDLFRGGIGIFVQQTLGRHDHARRTETTLNCPGVHKSPLERVQAAIGGEMLDRLHFRAGNPRHFHQAGALRFPIYQDGTGAAMTGGAAILCAGYFQIIAQEAQKHLVLRNFRGDLLPV